MDQWDASGTNKRWVDDDDMATNDDMLTGDAISSRWPAHNAHPRGPVVDAIDPGVGCPQVEKQLGGAHLPSLGDVRTDLFQRAMEVQAVRSERCRGEHHVGQQDQLERLKKIQCA
jgi:hypothetical protein